MDTEETLEEFLDSFFRSVRRQAQETPEQKANRWEKIAKYAGLSEDELQSIRAEILNQLH